MLKTENIRIRDPYVVEHDGEYYMYSSTNEGQGGDAFPKDKLQMIVYKSYDLVNWSEPKAVFTYTPSLRSKLVTELWAPEVHLVNGVYYMFYTAEERTCVATSTSPRGPFVQREQKPLIDGYKNIDNTLFIDDDGTPYMFYVRVGRPFKICLAELNDDLQSIKNECVAVCITPTQSWEKRQGRVNEGPSVIKHKGIYYMLYSGNGYKSQEYGVGYATAKSIKGPWRKSQENPILQLPGDLVGVGHGAPFYDKRGPLHYVFHAHNSFEKVHPRCMYIARASFKKSRRGDKIAISNKYITPKVIK